MLSLSSFSDLATRRLVGGIRCEPERPCIMYTGTDRHVVHRDCPERPLNGIKGFRQQQTVWNSVVQVIILAITAPGILYGGHWPLTRLFRR